MNTTALPTITSIRHLLQVLAAPGGLVLDDNDPDLLPLLEEAKAKGLIHYSLTLGSIFGNSTRWKLTNAGREYLDTGSDEGDLQPHTPADPPASPEPEVPAAELPMVDGVPVPYLEHPHHEQPADGPAHEEGMPPAAAGGEAELDRTAGSPETADGSPASVHVAPAEVQPSDLSWPLHIRDAAHFAELVEAVLARTHTPAELHEQLMPYAEVVAMQREAWQQFYGDIKLTPLSFTRRNVRRWAKAPHQFTLATLPDTAP